MVNSIFRLAYHQLRCYLSTTTQAFILSIIFFKYHSFTFLTQFLGLIWNKDLYWCSFNGIKEILSFRKQFSVNITPFKDENLILNNVFDNVNFPSRPHLTKYIVKILSTDRDIISYLVILQEVFRLERKKEWLFVIRRMLAVNTISFVLQHPTSFIYHPVRTVNCYNHLPSCVCHMDSNIQFSLIQLRDAGKCCEADLRKIAFYVVLTLPILIKIVKQL